MAFDKKLLHEHEDLVLDLRPHWWYMFEPTLGLVVVALIGLWLAGWVDGWDWLKYGAVGLIVVAIVWFAARYATWVTINFVVTTDRLIYRSGVFAKKGIEIPLERVNTVFFSQTIFERLLGAGDLSIESGGETGKQTFSDIRRPSAVQNEIYRQMEANNARMYGGAQPAAAPAPAPAANIPEQIAQLDALRQQGVLSEAEFAEKKAELLRRM